MRARGWIVVGGTGVVLALLGTIVNDAAAQRGGGRAGAAAMKSRGATGASVGTLMRDSPAASGGLSSRPSAQTPPSAPDRGQDAGARQESRQDAAAGRQSSRQESAAGRQEARQDVYQDEHWDEGKGLAIAATGMAAAAVMRPVVAYPPPPVSAEASSAFVSAPATPTPPPPPPPCADAATATVNGVEYARCGSAWYTLAFGPGGLTYVSSAPPPGS